MWSRARLLTALRCATERGGMPANSVRCAAYDARTCPVSMSRISDGCGAMQRQLDCRRGAGQRPPRTTSGEGFQSDFTGFFPDRGLLSPLQPSAQRQSRPGECGVPMRIRTAVPGLKTRCPDLWTMETKLEHVGGMRLFRLETKQAAFGPPQKGGGVQVKSTGLHLVKPPQPDLQSGALPFGHTCVGASRWT